MVNAAMEHIRFYNEAWKYIGTVIAFFAMYFVFGAIFVA